MDQAQREAELRKQILQEVRESLSISVSVSSQQEYGDDSPRVRVEVQLVFDGEVISESSDSCSID